MAASDESLDEFILNFISCRDGDKLAHTRGNEAVLQQFALVDSFLGHFGFVSDWFLIAFGG